MYLVTGLATVFGLGFLYFISAVPAGAALGVPLWAAAIASWLGYSSGGVLVAYAGAPLRDALMKRLKISPNPEKPSLILRAWNRFGLPALGLLAPLTIGPQAGALLALSLGATRGRVTLALSLGAIPYAIAFAVLIAFGFKLGK